ncbi:MAG: Dam family site-specific DNA-(adenine-N6)-methyltransferase [Candidatus Accumulibacter sp.]|uniref:site-specific DNA-methyltransferase (adenine-specific) n=1 Tax=Candidatus Accumulibacter affinis TaxID=2954384 RepID=A0A935TE64_9PROT|nr:Dam family site-specific DNA-(adenine-N6)-methyltransferase [Candidatus Accumulibacter affinis]
MKKQTILRWAGSKAKLIPDLLRLAPANFCQYVEPFAGSACLFFALKPKQAVLGDINAQVIDVYRAVHSDPHGVADALDSIPHTAEAYYQMRSINPSDLNLTQRAARIIFLMKACFNGVYRTNLRGEFNVPMGDRVYALPSRESLVETHQLLQCADLVVGDFRLTLDLCQAGDWVYMDPPYRTTSRYRGEYGHEGRFGDPEMQCLVDIARRLVSRGVRVTMSYLYDEDLVHALEDWHLHEVPTARTVASRTRFRMNAPEIILTSYVHNV